ncbi:hypothetical protein BKG76_18680 [Mycobacteroides franklinii]|uniref:Transport acessory protein MmpS n=1 Tax=Mycobacteroides franklinii TaxID=948102 RepID=A0A1S1L6I0_9MYCO|nr:MmpS family transport accessory protein [Mycobacteroides franklinii]OHU22474.1 hypothetical protein BKG76_18680 [Mycobacteroides franklinii]
MKRLLGALGRMWIVLVIVAVAGVGGLVIHRFHGKFGSDVHAGGQARGENIVSTVPKYVTYEVYGPADTAGLISYIDERAESRDTHFTALPWTLTLTTTVPSVFANIIAQGNGSALGCRITVNGELRDEQASDGFGASTSCLVKAA